MKKHLFTIVCALLSLQLYTANTLQVNNSEQEYELFSDCDRLVFDLENDPGINGVLNLKWYSAKELQLDQKNTRSAYYLKATIKNQQEAQLICHVYYVSLNKLSIYQVVDGEIIEADELGIYSDQSLFPFLHSYPMMELKDTKGAPFDLILRVEGIQTAYIPWFVSSINPMFEIRHYQDLFFGLVYGLLLLVVIYNLSLYYRLRENDNLVYALWVLLLAFHLAFFNGFIYEFILPDFSGKINIVDAVGAATGIMHIVFAVTFLKINWKKPAGRIALVIILWYIASIIITLLNFSEAFFPWMNPVFIVFLEGIFCLVMGVRAFIKGFKPALFFILANLSFFILISVVIAYGTTNSGHSFIGYHGFQLGSALEVIFFSFGLSYKVRLLKKEKDEALKEKAMFALENEKIVREQNVVLEQKVEERTKELSQEKARSENLLLNILPEQTAQELKDHGKARAKRYENVTILFTDFVGFTSVAENLDPEELVQLIDQYFSKFDEIIEQNGLEKIKTIGDAYMALANLPKPLENGEKAIVHAALAIRDYVDEQSKLNPDRAFKIRIGINTGSVVAGVVGRKKFQFDVWGDAVNTAARLEQTCEPGHINISQSTYKLVNNAFNCESRGMIEAKNKGSMMMYYLISAK